MAVGDDNFLRYFFNIFNSSISLIALQIGVLLSPFFWMAGGAGRITPLPPTPLSFTCQDAITNNLVVLGIFFRLILVVSSMIQK